MGVTLGAGPCRATAPHGIACGGLFDDTCNWPPAMRDHGCLVTRSTSFQLACIAPSSKTLLPLAFISIGLIKALSNSRSSCKPLNATKAALDQA